MVGATGIEPVTPTMSTLLLPRNAVQSLALGCWQMPVSVPEAVGYCTLTAPTTGPPRTRVLIGLLWSLGRFPRPFCSSSARASAPTRRARQIPERPTVKAGKKCTALASHSLLVVEQLFHTRGFPGGAVVARRSSVDIGYGGLGWSDTRRRAACHRTSAEELGQRRVILGLGHQGSPDGLASVPSLRATS